MQKDAPTVMFIPIPPAPDSRAPSWHNYWSSEKECHQWLLAVLQRVPEIQVFDELGLVDIYGNRARADIGIVIDRGYGQHLLVVEIKHKVTISANAAAAYVQAYHYRDMCIASDSRLPGSVNGRSPVFAFAGVFTNICMSPNRPMDRDHHEHRCDGMGILATSLKVGNIEGDPRNNRLSFHAGEQRLFNLTHDEKSLEWCSVADSYLFGREKRNGGRRDRQTVAEKFFEMQQTFKELF